MDIRDIERYNRLLETYGMLLSEKALGILTDYLTYGLSITEIADARDISKQSVSTTIRRGLRNLEKYEKKLGLVDLIDIVEDTCPNALKIWLEKRGRGER